MRVRYGVLGLLVMVAGCGEPAVDTGPQWLPDKAEYAELLAEGADTESPVGYLVIKVVEGSAARLRGGKLTGAPEHAEQLTQLEARIAQLGLSGVERLFADEAPEAVEAERQQLIDDHRVDIGDLNLFLVAYAEEGIDRVAAAKALNALPAVEIAYAQPKVVGPPVAPSYERCNQAVCQDNDYQHYLAPAPKGVDAASLWCFAGGRGEDVVVYDLEGGWNVNHVEFTGRLDYLGDYPEGNAYDNTRGVTDYWSFYPRCGEVHHGTSVFGEILAADDGHGVTGIAPEARGVATDMYARTFIGALPMWARGLRRALRQAQAGDVFLIEQHFPLLRRSRSCDKNSQCGLVPQEVLPGVRRVIAAATARGVTVVEAAGNGGQDLDHWIYLGLFNRRFFDSGAIVVGATEGGRSEPASFTNVGSRVDVHASGRNVVTTGGGNLHRDQSAPVLSSAATCPITNEDYTAFFSGTSSASPIVVGAVTMLQGIARAAGDSLEPRCLRSVLVETGLSQEGPASGDGDYLGPIGVFPRPLQALFELAEMPAPPTTPPACAQPIKIQCRTGADCASGLCQVFSGGTRCAKRCSSAATCGIGEHCEASIDGRGDAAGSICVPALTAAEVACRCEMTAGLACTGGLVTADTHPGGGSGGGSQQVVVKQPDPSTVDATLVYADEGFDWNVCQERAKPTFKRCVYRDPGGCSVAGGAASGTLLPLLLGLALVAWRRRR